jgi:hypothetical protein
MARRRLSAAVKVLALVVERTRVTPPVAVPVQAWKKPCLWATCLSNSALAMR